MLWTLLFSFFYIVQISAIDDNIGENKTIIEALHSNVTVTSGQKAILTCIFDRKTSDLSSLSSHQLIWIRQSHASYDADLILAHNQDLLISDDRLTVQRTDIDYSLVITDVNINDEGLYACEVNTELPQKATIHLYVQEISMIIDNPTSSVIVNEHENVTLKCQARGRPTPYIAWYRQNQVLANNTDGQYHLINVNRYQTGHYECRASNGVNQHVVSKDIELRVLFPPSIRAESTLIYSTIGKSIELRCSAIVPFDGKIYWQRMDNTSIPKSRQQQHQQKHDDTIQTSLYLTDIESNDFGVYGCFAESMGGQSHASIELREHLRSTTLLVVEKNESTTSRIQILKRNKISDQTTMAAKYNHAFSLHFSLFDLSFIFIHIIFYNLT